MVITLTRSPDCWLATYDDPQVIELFGTPTVPTPFTPATVASVVLRKIQELNPDAVVLIA
jgi:hypothetical protein